MKLDNGLVIKGNEGSFDFKDGQRFNGYDADGDRMTNITGFNGDELKKWCPHCKEIFLSSDFGSEGRPTNDPDHRRDQSWCKICRKGE